MHNYKLKKQYALMMVVLGWLTFLLNIKLRIIDSDKDAIMAITEFFSYFTILTNLLVTLYFTNCLTKRKITLLNTQEALYALTVYIIIVGLVFNIFFKQYVHHVGWQIIVSNFNHGFAPIATFIYWYFFANKYMVSFPKLCYWVVYPIFYIVFVAINGYITSFYPPYQFGNLTLSSPQGQVVFVLALIIGSLLCFLLLIQIGKWIDKNLYAYKNLK